MDLDLADLRAFTALARHGHYGQAGRSVGLTASGLSRAVQRVEQVVGAELVDRDSGGVRGLTGAGERLLAAAAPLLDHTATALHEAREAARRRPVRVAFPGLARGLRPLPLADRCAARLFERHPDVALRFVPVPFAAMFSALGDDRADIVVTSVEHPDPRVLSTPVAPLRRVGLVGRGHALAEASALPVDDFAELRLISDPDLPSAYVSTWTLGDVRGGVRHRDEMVSLATMDRVLRLVAGGAAIVTQDAWGVMPGPFSIVPLTGVPTAWHVIDRRRDDRRPAVLAVVEALRWALREPRGEPASEARPPAPLPVTQRR